MIYLSGSCVLNAQLPDYPYEPLEYETISPIWYKTVYDSIEGLGENDGYNYIFNIRGVDPIVTENEIYTVYTFRGEGDLHAGVIIEKRSLIDGSLLWKQKFDIFNNERQEVPNHIYLDEDDNLVVLGMKRYNPWLVEDEKAPRIMAHGGSKNCRFAKRIYNGKNGELLSYNNPDLKDTTLLILQNKDGLKFRNSYDYFVSNNDIFYVGQTTNFTSSPAKHMLTFDRLNYDGQSIQTKDTINYLGLNDIRNFTPLEDNLGYIDIEEYFDTLGVKHANFVFIDEDFKLVRKQPIELPDQSVRLTLLDIKEGRLLIGNTLDIIQPFNRQEVETLIYDFDGTILKSNYIGNLYFSFYHIWVIEWDETEVILAAAGVRLSDVGYFLHLDILKSDPIGGYVLEKTHLNKDPKRYIELHYIKKLEDENYLLQFYESVYYLHSDGVWAQDAKAYAQSYMVVTPYDLGVLTSDIVDVPDPAIKIYPNPAQDLLNVELSGSTNGAIAIYDLLGRKVSRTSIDQVQEISIDISQLPSNTYIVKILTPDGKMMYESYKFVKVE